MSRIVPQPQRAGPDLSLMLWSMPFRFRIVATLGVTGAVETRPGGSVMSPEPSACDCGTVRWRPRGGSPRLASEPVLRDEQCGQRKPRLEAPLRRENSSHIPLF